MKMPLINHESLGLEGRDLEIATACCVRGRLRSTKPADGEVAYVWRMVAFCVSPHPRHQCMPIGADFGLREQFWSVELSQRTDLINQRITELDKVTDTILNSINKIHWCGVHRWGNVL